MMAFSRRFVLGVMVAAGLAGSALAADFAGAELVAPTDRVVEKFEKFQWYEGTDLGLEGRGFEDTHTSYSRLAVRYKGEVTTSVWNHGLSAAGVTLRFVTDATSISARWNSNAPMNHMAYSGSGGLDLYVRRGDGWQYAGVCIPTAKETVANFRLQAFSDRDQPREYLMFLPLYSRVDYLQIGVPEGAKIAAAPARYEDKKPVVFYGTSITQGGCASRSGMAHPGILRRKLDLPVLNLGFSGSARCEPAMAELLGEIDAELYVLEPVSNMTPTMIDERVVPFVKQLRGLRPDTPILMVESPNKDARTNERYRASYDALVAQGVTGLHYLPGADLYGTTEEPTVDGAHPTDLGFYRMAESYEPVIRKLLPAGKD